MNKDSDTNPTSPQQDMLEALAMTKEAIDARLSDMVNTALMSEATIINCFDMDKPYFNTAVCGIARMISKNTKHKNAGIYVPIDSAYCELVGQMLMEAIYNDLREEAEARI